MSRRPMKSSATFAMPLAELNSWLDDVVAEGF